MVKIWSFKTAIQAYCKSLLPKYIKWSLSRSHVLKAGAGANRIVKNKSPHDSQSIAK